MINLLNTLILVELILPIHSARNGENLFFQI